MVLTSHITTEDEEKLSVYEDGNTTSGVAARRRWYAKCRSKVSNPNLLTIPAIAPVCTNMGLKYPIHSPIKGRTPLYPEQTLLKIGIVEQTCGEEG